MDQKLRSSSTASVDIEKPTFILDPWLLLGAGLFLGPRTTQYRRAGTQRKNIPARRIGSRHRLISAISQLPSRYISSRPMKTARARRVNKKKPDFFIS
jgi:hypothetical protein